MIEWYRQEKFPIAKLVKHYKLSEIFNFYYNGNLGA
jgi:hypothetical protein